MEGADKQIGDIMQILRHVTMMSQVTSYACTYHISAYYLILVKKSHIMNSTPSGSYKWTLVYPDLHVSVKFVDTL
jgi:hypothetical protein